MKKIQLLGVCALFFCMGLTLNAQKKTTILIDGQEFEEEFPVNYSVKENRGDSILTLSKLSRPKLPPASTYKGFYLKSVADKYKYDIGFERQRSIKLFKREKKVTNALFNDKMLNLLISDKIGAAFGGSTGLSLNKFYATIDNSDGSLSLGTNFDFRKGNSLSKLNKVLSLGLKLKSESEFASIYELEKDAGGFSEDNIGITLKFTRVGKGIINFSDKRVMEAGSLINAFLTKNFKSKVVKSRREAVEQNRELLFKKYRKKVKDFNEKELVDFVTQYEARQKYDKELQAYIQKALDTKRDEMYKELAKEEISFIEENEMYNYLYTNWLSFEVYVPMGESVYSVTPDFLTSASTKKLWLFNASASWNHIVDYSNGNLFSFQMLFNAKNNNNIIAKKGVSETVFQDTIATPAIDSYVVPGSTTKAYVLEDYDRFISLSLKFEPAYFFIKEKFGKVGLSPAIEFNYDMQEIYNKFDRTNWKIGIPVSLNDKDGKPTVNFELMLRAQRELGSNKSIKQIGLSTSFLFGKFIN